MAAVAVSGHWSHGSISLLLLAAGGWRGPGAFKLRRLGDSMPQLAACAGAGCPVRRILLLGTQTFSDNAENSRQSYYGVERDCDKQHCQCRSEKMAIHIVFNSWFLFVVTLAA